MIELENVAFGYESNKKVIDGIDLKIDDGESVGLIGPNGAGKSTLFMLMLGLLSGSGSIRVDGEELSKKTLPSVRAKLGMLLQNSDDQMFMPTVFDDMMFAPLNYGISREDAEKKVDAVLEKLGLTELKHRYNHRISGGEKRMAAIATILAMEPEMILMDEPTSALDPYNRRIVINTIRSLGGTKLIASHDLDMILDTCSRVILISDGQLAADGPAEEILHDKALLESHRMELPFCLAGQESVRTRSV